VQHSPILHCALLRSERYDFHLHSSLTRDKLERAPCPSTPHNNRKSAVPPSHSTVRCSANLFRNGALSNTASGPTTRMGIDSSPSNRNTNTLWPAKLILWDTDSRRQGTCNRQDHRTFDQPLSERRSKWNRYD
jgi:hypothetical protein